MRVTIFLSWYILCTYVDVPMRYSHKFRWHLLLFIAGKVKKGKGKHPLESEDFDRYIPTAIVHGTHCGTISSHKF